MLVNASKLLIDKELFGFDEIIEIKTELEKVIEAVEAIQGDIDFCKEQLEKELSKEQERKKLEVINFIRLINIFNLTTKFLQN